MGRSAQRMAGEFLRTPTIENFMRFAARLFLTTTILLFAHASLFAQEQVEPKFDQVEEMIPMRDGVKLFTTIHIPTGAKESLPIIFLRTPYGIHGRTDRLLQNYFKDLARDGYIFVLQDIRGRYQSEGKFVMLRPRRDHGDPKSVDEASDTHDTIEWLLKNVKNNNGRVGMLGVSYPGWLTAVAMLDPHP